MSVKVALSGLRQHLADRGDTALLITVGDDGRPHCVSVALSWTPTGLAMTVGRRTLDNAQRRPLVSLICAAEDDQTYVLIIDADVTTAGGTAEGDHALVVTPTSAILHRRAQVEPPGPVEPSPVEPA